MRKLFAVMVARGPAWRDAQPMEGQAEWTAHAQFMDALVDEGFVVLGGPLAGSADVLLIVRAESSEEIEERLAPDPWRRLGLLETKRISPWTLRLGALA